MGDTFWTNTIWYIALAATSAAVLTVVFIKSPHRKFTLGFWLAVLGATYVIEVFLLLVTDAYTYYPMLTTDKFQDAVLGNFFSQFSVSSTAVLMVVLRLSRWWRVGFSIAYFLIDVLFVQLGIYEHHWYRSYYTLAGFFIYSWLVQKWHHRLLQKPGRLIYLFTLFFGVFAIAGNSIITSLKLLGIQIFQPGFVTDMSKDHTSGSLIYGPVLIILCIALYFWKVKWCVKAGVLAIIATVQYLLIALGLLYIKSGWMTIVILIDILGFYGWTVAVDRLLDSRQLNYKRISPPLQ